MDRFVKSDIIEHINENGKKEKGVFIPLKENNVYKTRGGWALYFNVKESLTNTKESSHYITQNFTKKHKAKIIDLLKEKKATMGYLTPLWGKIRNLGDVSENNLDNILNK